MPRTKLKPIPEPDDKKRAILEFAEVPGMVGAGDNDYACGWCDAVLVKGLRTEDRISDVVFRCPACGKYSEPWSFN